MTFIGYSHKPTLAFDLETAAELFFNRLDHSRESDTVIVSGDDATWAHFREPRADVRLAILVFVEGIDEHTGQSSGDE
jgi:hypothetical protein